MKFSFSGLRVVIGALAFIGALLSGCGAGTSQTDAAGQQAKHLSLVTKAQASDYDTVVQQLYVAYFGRPADPAGLANFENALLAAGAPTDIGHLSSAYAGNATIQALVNAFGTSKESQNLYGSGTTTAFVTAVFNNVLGRTPAQSGLDFWVNAISSGSLSQGNAALAIMAGGLSNNTAQGLIDSQLINNRLTVAANFTAQVSIQNAETTYSGATAAAAARQMLASVTSTTDTDAFQTTVVNTVADLGQPASGVITTVAGNGQEGYFGDTGLATNAQLRYPGAVAVDANGNFYIADSGNNVVRKVSAKGIITTVAGNGKSGYTGDNGQAINANFNCPTGLAFDSKGNLYIADRYNNVVREIAVATGVITTIAGNTYGSPKNSPATNTSMLFNDNPAGLSIDSSDNVYIPDGGNQVVRKVTPSGTISIVAGTGRYGYSGDTGQALNAMLNNPVSVAVDSSGNVYIDDASNLVIRKVTASTGIITTVAGNGNDGYTGDGGPALSATFYSPASVSIDTKGNLYISDTTSQVVRKVQH